MFDRHPADHLISSLIVSTAAGGVSLLAVLMADDEWSIFKSDGLGIRCAIAVALSITITCARPLMLRMGWHRRRNVFLSNNDLNSALLGRLLGGAIGVGLGAVLARQWL